MKSSEKFRKPEVNASSMADIAFLLLIFFLVTTTIFNDQGILTKLPPYVEDTPPVDLPDKNVLKVQLNGKNDLLVEGQFLKIDQLRAITKEFIANPLKEENKPTNAKNAVISLHHDRSTKFAYYLSVYNELKGAYHELWEEAAQNRYNMGFNELTKKKQKEIRLEIPLVISEAEPTDHFASVN